MGGLALDIFRVADLHQRAGVEHVNAVAGREREAQVVGDQDQAHVAPLLDLGQQRQNLGLGGDVEGGRGLVGDQQLGIARQSRCQRHPLGHTAGELEGKALGHRGRDPDLVEPPLDLGRARPARAERGSVQHLLDMRAAAQQRVEHGERVLEHQGDPRAADLPQGRFRGGHQIDVLEPHAAAGADALGQEAHDRARGQRLARAALADDADGLAATHGEIGAHGDDLLPGGDRQAAHVEHRVSRRSAHRANRRSR
jgi:hypothetical protein